MSDTPAQPEAPTSFETTIQNPRCAHWMWIAKVEQGEDGICKTVDVSKPKQCKLNFNHAPPCVFDKIIKHKKPRAYKNKPKDLLMGKCGACKRYTSLLKKGANKGKCDWCAERNAPYISLKEQKKQARGAAAVTAVSTMPETAKVTEQLTPDNTAVAPVVTPPAASPIPPNSNASSATSFTFQGGRC